MAKILTLEEDTVLKSSLENVLRKQHVVASVQNIYELEDTLAVFLPDVLLIDISASNHYNGQVICDGFQTDPRTKGIPIIALVEEGYEDKGLHRYDYLLRKPVDMPALAGLIQTLLYGNKSLV